MRRTPPPRFYFFLPLFRPSSSQPLLCWPVGVVLCDMAQCSNTAERIRRRVVLLGLVASKNHSGPGYKYSRFLSMAAVCSPGYGWALETPVVDRKQSNLGGCPGFSTLYDGLTFFLAPHYPTSCGKWMKGG
jgi:hypothetical protein